MPNDITTALDTDPDILFNDAVVIIQAAFPDWVPSEAQIETIVMQAIALMESETRDIIGAIQDTAFKYFGISILQLPMLDPTYATVTSTWTFRDAVGGYKIADGTMVAIERNDGSTAIFEVVDGFTVAPAASTVSDVLLIAQDSGVVSTGIGSGSVELVEVADFVIDVTLASLTTGGVDGETDDDYMARLKEELTLLTPTPILPADYEIQGRSRFAAVIRALCLPTYNPGDDTYNNGGYVTLAVIDGDGNALTSGDMDDIDEYFNSVRLDNVVYNTIAPTTTSIDSTFAAVALPGYDVDELEITVIAALTGWLSPANWGSLPFSDGNEWRKVATVRISEAYEVVNSVAGVDYVTAVTLAGAGVDVTLTGAAPLTSPGVITGAITAP